MKEKENCPFEGLTPQECSTLRRLIIKEELREKQNRLIEIIDKLEAMWGSLSWIRTIGDSKLSRPKESAFDEAMVCASSLARWTDELKDLVKEIYTTAKALSEMKKGGLR